MWGMIVLLPIWVAISFIAAQFITGILLAALDFLQFSLLETMSNAVFQTIISSFIYILTLVIVAGVPYWLKKKRTNLKVLGLDSLPTWTDIGLSPMAYIGYLIIGYIASYLVVVLIPSFPIDQAQDIGFQVLGRQYEYALAFLTLVVIAPIAEETLFRGYLYGKLQKYVPIIPALLATSLLFGFAHLFTANQLQWNVALDTFILSIVLCLLRNITGSIWAGILLHMIKNGIAFFILFGGAMSLMT